MDKLSFIRVGILVLALINQVLAMYGKSPLAIDTQEAELLLSTIFTIVVAGVNAYKNNYLTKTGKRQKAVLKANNLYKP